MERPICSKCVNSGRECEGFERDRVFITGTPQDRGRVASHPKKGPPSRKATPRPEGQSSPTVEGSASPNPDRVLSTALLGADQTAPAWDEYISLMCNSTESQVLVSALQVGLHAVGSEPVDLESDASVFKISLPQYTSSELLPFGDGDDFDVRAQCLLHIRGVEDESGAAGGSHCAFLFEVS